MVESRPPKRERTRRRLIEAGLHVFAERGEALTASDVVAAADVSNGTFYNHFVDREQFVQVLAHESLASITQASADDHAGADPAWRFAVASTNVLAAAAADPRWGRAVLRLAESPTPLHAAVQQHLRADLDEGQRTGRFSHGADDITIDLVSGTLLASMRRLITSGRPGHQAADSIADVVTRLLETIGVDPTEARALASDAAGVRPAVSAESR